MSREETNASVGAADRTESGSVGFDATLAAGDSPALGLAATHMAAGDHPHDLAPELVRGAVVGRHVVVGRLGVVRVHTASGDIEVGDATRVDVTTASGSISCGDVSGDAHISSISGDCTLHRIGGRVDAALTSGDLRIEVCDGDMAIVATSGDVRVGHCGGSDIAVRSISGDVRVGLPSGIRVDAEISTLSGRATLPEPAPASDLGDRRPVSLQLKTVSGDIRVERTT